MKLSVSVITCTHNPKLNYLDKVMQGLQSQTLPFNDWEYLLIDNSSDHPLTNTIDLNWHPNAHHLFEEKLGLTHARIKGISQSQGNILVFVDDDNVLAKNYLETAIDISKKYFFIGAFGGQIFGEYEITPANWTAPHLSRLGIREFEEDKWSNLVNQFETTPCGAGMCIRKKVAETYSKLVKEDLQRLKLDRVGSSLSSCGDSDLAFTACDIGLGTGLFSSLKLTHLIPKERLDEKYLLQLTEEMIYSKNILFSFRHKPLKTHKENWKTMIIKKLKMGRMSGLDRKFYQAKQNGRNKALQTLERMGYFK